MIGRVASRRWATAKPAGDVFTAWRVGDLRKRRPVLGPARAFSVDPPACSGTSRHGWVEPTATRTWSCGPGAGRRRLQEH